MDADTSVWAASLVHAFKVAGGPNAKTPLKRIRITRGKYFSSGKTFKIIDDWTTRANAHWLLEGSWIGTTDFQEVAEYIDDDSDEDQEEERKSELGECLVEPLTKDLCVRPVELETAPKLKEDTAEESMKASRLTEQSVEPHTRTLQSTSKCCRRRKTIQRNPLKH